MLRVLQARRSCPQRLKSVSCDFGSLDNIQVGFPWAPSQVSSTDKIKKCDLRRKPWQKVSFSIANARWCVAFKNAWENRITWLLTFCWSYWNSDMLKCPKMPNSNVLQRPPRFWPRPPINREVVLIPRASQSERAAFLTFETEGAWLPLETF